MSEDVASANNIRILDSEIKNELLVLAKELRGDVHRMGDVISHEVLFKERLLATAVTQLVEAASDPHITLEEACKVLTVAAKLHGEWNSAVAPIARRLGEDIRRMRKELEAKGGDWNRGKALLAGPAGGSGDWAGGAGRRDTAGTTRVEAYGQAPGGPGPVVEGPVDIPDGKGPGHGQADHLDTGPAGQEESD